MTTPTPADPAQVAPSLIGTGIDAMVQNAGRLGLTWGLLLATVIDGTNPNDVTAKCDGDTEGLTMVSMVGTLSQGERVYVIQVPPSGLFVVGRQFQSFFGSIGFQQVSGLGERSVNTFGDLDDDILGPIVTVTISPVGKAIVILGAEVLVNGTAFSGIMSYSVSGASTKDPDITDHCFQATNPVVASGLNTMARACAVVVQDDLNAGVNVFTAKYRARNNGGSMFMASRVMVVIPL